MGVWSSMQASPGFQSSTTKESMHSDESATKCLRRLREFQCCTLEAHFELNKECYKRRLEVKTIAKKMATRGHLTQGEYRLIHRLAFASYEVAVRHWLVARAVRHHRLNSIRCGSHTGPRTRTGSSPTQLPNNPDFHGAVRGRTHLEK